jgi:hypothetical protein
MNRRKADFPKCRKDFDVSRPCGQKSASAGFLKPWEKAGGKAGAALCADLKMRVDMSEKAPRGSS